MGYSIFSFVLLWTCSLLVDGEEARFLKGCFSLHSRVSMADGTYKRLGNIVAGDDVLSWSSEGRSSSRVVQIFHVWRADIARIQLESGSQLQTTFDHPFWSHRLQRLVSLNPNQTKSSYGLDVGQLDEAEVFQDEFGFPMAGSVSKEFPKVGQIEVGTLMLADHHWFFVEGVRVHNKGGRGGGKGSRSSKSSRHRGRRRIFGVGVGSKEFVFLIIIFSFCGCGCLLFCMFGCLPSRYLTFCMSKGSKLRHQYDVKGFASGKADHPELADGLLDGQYACNYVENKQRKLALYKLEFCDNGEVRGHGEDIDGQYRLEGKYNLEKGMVGWLETYSWGVVDVLANIKKSQSDQPYEIVGEFGASTGVHGTIELRYQLPTQSGCIDTVIGVPVGSDAVHASGAPGVAEGQPAPPDIQTHPFFSSHTRYTDRTLMTNQVVQGRPAEVTLPPGWTAHEDYSTQDTYYHNASMNISYWRPPAPDGRPSIERPSIERRPQETPQNYQRQSRRKKSRGR